MVPMVPWYHAHLGTPCPSTVYRPYHTGCRAVTARPLPGLREAFSLRVRGSSKRACALVLPYVRSDPPGHPDRLRSIRGECWIASRSRSARAGQAQRAWPGHPFRAPCPEHTVIREMPGSGPVPDPGIVPDPGPVRPPDPGIWDPDPGILASPAGQDLCTSGQFCQKCRLAPPEFTEKPETAGKWLFPAVSFLAGSRIPTARAELKPSLLSIWEMLKSWDSGEFHSI